MALIKVAETSDLNPGDGKTVFANGTAIALFNINGKFYAIDNVCKHQGGPLGEGFLDGNIVSCPWHGWMYDVTTGQGMTMPVQQKTFKVKIEGNDVLVEI